MKTLLLLLALALPASALPASAEAACRQALALGLDVSGSVDPREYRLQLDGLAAALASDEVRTALLATPEAPVRLAVFEWSGPETQHHLLPWTAITDEGALLGVIATLRGTTRTEGELSTAIGAAMLTGVALLNEATDCWTRTLDLSGDGQANTGPRPQFIRDTEIPDDVTINALVIGAIPQGGDDRAEDVRELAAYYRGNVTKGPASFIEVAVGFEDYETAMRRKLLRELVALAIGDAGPAPVSRYNGSVRPDTAPSAAAPD